jgi:hypothetical protein
VVLENIFQAGSTVFYQTVHMLTFKTKTYQKFHLHLHTLLLDISSFQFPLPGQRGKEY